MYLILILKFRILLLVFYITTFMSTCLHYLKHNIAGMHFVLDYDISHFFVFQNSNTAFAFSCGRMTRTWFMSLLLLKV